nr:hypothetical protein [Tanacetum cinerariifolium]
MEETHHRWRFGMLSLSLRTTEYMDRVKAMTRILSCDLSRIIPRRLKTCCVGYCHGFLDLHSSTIMEEIRHRWKYWMLLLSLRTTEYRDRVEPTTRIILPKIEDFLCRILSWFSRPSYLLLDFSLGKSVSMIYIAYS